MGGVYIYQGREGELKFHIHVRDVLICDLLTLAYLL